MTSSIKQVNAQGRETHSEPVSFRMQDEQVNIEDYRLNYCHWPLSDALCGNLPDKPEYRCGLDASHPAHYEVLVFPDGGFIDVRGWTTIAFDSLLENLQNLIPDPD